jgi:UDP-glucose 4-epimerase
MTLLVTGGTGFVMSVLARHWAERQPGDGVVILDRSPLDAAAQRHFAPVADRVAVVTADMAQTGWEEALAGRGIDRIVHGATLTPLSRGTAAEARRDPEAEQPAAIMDVNLMGTVRLLEWARRQPRIERFLYVSSGAVYRNNGPDWPGEPLPEDGYVMPLRLYGISKFASELVVNRYAELFHLSAASVRLSSVYGPMDRVTTSRNFRHVPNKVAHLALAGKTIRANTLDAVGDYLHSGDVAEACRQLLLAPKLRYRVYNIASGVATTTADLVAYAAEKIPGTRAEIVSAEEADILTDPALRDGMWGAYDVSRIQAEVGWRPRPVREALHDYIDWIRANEAPG